MTLMLYSNHCVQCCRSQLLSGAICLFETTGIDDEIYSYESPSKIVYWSELDRNLKENILSFITVNACSIPGEIADLVTSLVLIRKRFFLDFKDVILSYRQV